MISRNFIFPLALLGLLQSASIRADAEIRIQVAGHLCELGRVGDTATGIPSAKSDESRAVWGCLGYLHARDRAWQMDFLRRIVRGKTAELLGKDAIKQDFFMRLLGLDERARAIFATMSPESRERLQIYAEGVNQGLAEALKKGIYEFREYRYTPDPWAPEDSVALVLLQAFSQTEQSFETQLSQEEWRKTYGKLAESLFSRDGTPWDTSILKSGESGTDPGEADVRTASLNPEMNERAVAELRAFLPRPWLGPHAGSNNWVIAPSRSQTGHAWLANDPHLDLKRPSFWYFSQLQGGALDIFGVSVPGIPQIAAGANRHVAWGLTNSFLNSARLSLVPAEQIAHAPQFTPVIYFKWGIVQVPFFFKSFQRTANGWPILPLDVAPGKALILRWTGFDLEANDFIGAEKLMAARNAREADQALQEFGIPSWNFVFADDQGTIGYRAVGRTPKDEKYPAFGIPEENLDQLGSGASFPRLLSPSEMPHLFQPERGYIVTANNRQWPAGAPLDPGRSQASSFRAFRIEELLQATPKHDLNSIRVMQCDTQAIDARFLFPLLLRELKAVAPMRALGPREKAVITTLDQWASDGSFNALADCRGCAVYEKWLADLMDQASLNRDAVFHALSDLRSTVPNLEPMVYHAFLTALDELKVGDDGRLPRWGDIHQAHFDHLSGDARFAVPALATPGGDESVDPGAWSWVDGSFHHDEGASMRLVIEMTSPPRVHYVLAGTNDDTESPDLNAALSAWRNCELTRYPLTF